MVETTIKENRKEVKKIQEIKQEKDQEGKNHNLLNHFLILMIFQVHLQKREKVEKNLVKKLHLENNQKVLKNLHRKLSQNQNPKLEVKNQKLKLRKRKNLQKLK